MLGVLFCPVSVFVKYGVHDDDHPLHEKANIGLFSDLHAAEYRCPEASVMRSTTRVIVHGGKRTENKENKEIYNNSMTMQVEIGKGGVRKQR